MNFRVRTILFAALSSFPLFAHEDVINGSRGIERAVDPIQGQGKNSAKDQAYAMWAQYDDNQTVVLERPLGKKWITVAEAIPFAKRVWNVNILDETRDDFTKTIKFSMTFGAVPREMALPLFLEALGSAVEMHAGFYVEQDNGDRYVNRDGARNFHKGTVHIRKMRPLQPDYDHPFNPDKPGIKKLDAELKATPQLSDRYTAPYGRPDDKCMDCQAEAARILLEFYTRGGDKAMFSKECLEAIAAIPNRERHSRTWYEHKHGEEPAKPFGEVLVPVPEK
jgi:hypothetical protein